MNPSWNNISPLQGFAISAAPALLGGTLSAISQYMTNKANIANQWDMWNATNLYNSPSSQMERYKMAGLNPHLIYGQSNTASSMPVGISQPMNFDFLAQAAQSGLSEFSRRENTPFDLALKALDVDIHSIEYAFSQATLADRVKAAGNQAQLSDKQLSYLQHQITLAIEQAEGYELDNAIKTLEKAAAELHLKYDTHAQIEEIFPNISPTQRFFLNILTGIFDAVGISFSPNKKLSITKN